MKRTTVKSYLRQMQRGHTPKIKERDIGYAFKMRNRMDMFNMEMSEVDAHSLKLIEIIESEITKMHLNKKMQTERQVNHRR